ncbi:MAG: GNAT family N-acetyltransferase, partial [Actinomycetota bacterium]|nr:GNAT family N-acetyltransferase [Actinomycetota bacterium]
MPALDEAIARNIEHLRPWMHWIVYEPASVNDRVNLIESWNGQWADGGDSVFGVFLGDEVIGGTGLHRRVGTGGIELGYWIGKDHIRNGYATELA